MSGLNFFLSGKTNIELIVESNRVLNKLQQNNDLLSYRFRFNSHPKSQKVKKFLVELNFSSATKTEHILGETTLPSCSKSFFFPHNSHD